MYKTIVFAFIVAIVSVNGEPEPEAKPGVLGAYVAAPAVVPGVVAATSSQVIARNYNTLAAPLVAAAPVVRAAPVVAAPAVAPYVASPYIASPYVASPYVASPYVASPYVASPYVAAPYVAPAW